MYVLLDTEFKSLGDLWKYKNATVAARPARVQISRQQEWVTLNYGRAFVKCVAVAAVYVTVTLTRVAGSRTLYIYICR